MFSLFHHGPDLEEGLAEAEKTEDAVLLDVRTPEEYDEGHLPGSVNLPLDRIETIAIAPSRPLFVYCRSGARSAQACSILKRRGYDARNIGGVLGYRGRLERGTEE